MTKTCLLYDGSFKGLMTAVYLVLDRNLSEVTILCNNKYSTGAGGCKIEVQSRDLCLADVRRMIRVKAGEAYWQLIFRAFLSELKGAEDCILEFVQLVADSECFVPRMEKQTCIRNIRHAAGMVQRAEERFYEITRTRLENKKEKWISLQPTFDLVPLLASRLSEEFPEKRWVLWDNRRNSGWCFNGEFLEPVNPAFNPERAIQSSGRSIGTLGAR
ncbi:DUF4130 domain-containing protein [Robertkochia flava]|uniref:DUF4130 domain-containing protein n=1 Tax=Robertkochia flava TaxID=3447986 RepID=UPI001CCCD6C5|nr:DUF4130 domain-containing protein [Robertkochia marina]